MAENIDQQDAPPEWWCGACPDPDVCTTTARCTLQTEMESGHRRVDALIAATRAETRQRLTAELARYDDLLTRYELATQDGTHPALTAARQADAARRRAVEALIAAHDSPDEDHPRLLAAADQAMDECRQAITALAALADTAGQTDD